MRQIQEQRGKTFIKKCNQKKKNKHGKWNALFSFLRYSSMDHSLCRRNPEFLSAKLYRTQHLNSILWNQVS